MGNPGARRVDHGIKIGGLIRFPERAIDARKRARRWGGVACTRGDGRLLRKQECLLAGWRDAFEVGICLLVSTFLVKGRKQQRGGVLTSMRLTGGWLGPSR